MRAPADKETTDVLRVLRERQRADSTPGSRTDGLRVALSIEVGGTRGAGGLGGGGGAWRRRRAGARGRGGGGRFWGAGAAGPTRSRAPPARAATRVWGPRPRPPPPGAAGADGVPGPRPPRSIR